MIAALWGWLTGNAAGPMASALALLLAAGLIGQTVRIDGLPLLGGGFKAEIAGLQQQVAARDLADAKARADALAARQKWMSPRSKVRALKGKRIGLPPRTWAMASRSASSGQ